MGIWATLAFTAATYIVSFLLRPKRSDEAEREDRYRTANTPENTPVPIAYGRVRLDQPTLLWFGEFAANRSPDNYTMVFQVGLCLTSPLAAPDAATLYRIWIGGDLWYSSSGGLAHDDAGVLVVAISQAEREFFGGDNDGGGFSGTFEWFGGTFQQERSFLLQQTGDLPDSTLPAYRGLAHIVFEVNIGETPTLRPMAFEVEVQPDNLGQGAVGSLGDANPAEILWDLLRGDWGRLGLENALVDNTSFVAAAATLDSEGHGMAMVIGDGQARDAIQEVLRQIDGVLYEEPSTRELTLKLIRNDYTVSALPVFDEDDIFEVTQFSVGQLRDTANQVRVTYLDRSDDYQQRTESVQDSASIAERGSIVTADLAFLGITNQTLARQVAQRELDFLSRPLVQLTLMCTRRAATLRPGDVIRVAWADYGITGLICRVQSFDLGELDDGRVRINLVQDPFSNGFNVTS